MKCANVQKMYMEAVANYSMKNEVFTLGLASSCKLQKRKFVLIENMIGLSVLPFFTGKFKRKA